MPGLLKHTWTTSVKDDVGTSISQGALVITGSAEFNEKISVAASETLEIDCGSIALASIISIVLVSDKDVTVHTNAADATGGQTIVLKAGQGWAWNNTLPSDNPVTNNITKIFVTNAGSATAVFKAAILMDLLA